MIDSTILLSDLRRRLRLLERDLAERADDVPTMEDSLAREYRTGRNVGRTGDSFGAWRSAELTQTAAAWLIGCVFVRFAEDNGLLATPLIGGLRDRTTAAEARQTAYFRSHPTATDRDYLLDVLRGGEPPAGDDGAVRPRSQPGVALHHLRRCGARLAGVLANG